MLPIPNALCWSSRKCNCACSLPAEVQLPLRVTCRSWQKLFEGKNFVKILVTAQTQLRSYNEQQRAFGNNNICNSVQINVSNFWILHSWMFLNCNHHLSLLGSKNNCNLVTFTCVIATFCKAIDHCSLMLFTFFQNFRNLWCKRIAFSCSVVSKWSNMAGSVNLCQGSEHDLARTWRCTLSANNWPSTTKEQGSQLVHVSGLLNCLIEYHLVID